MYWRCYEEGSRQALRNDGCCRQARRLLNLVPRALSPLSATRRAAEIIPWVRGWRLVGHFKMSTLATNGLRVKIKEIRNIVPQ